LVEKPDPAPEAEYDAAHRVDYIYYRGLPAILILVLVVVVVDATAIVFFRAA
jgi:hypothetical protein